MLLFALAALFVGTRNLSREAFLAGASHVGYELVTTTNSERVTAIEPALKSSLTAFLASPAKVQSVRRETTGGDNPKGPRATVRLVNEAGEMFDITLCRQLDGKFVPVEFRYPPPPAAPPR